MLEYGAAYLEENERIVAELTAGMSKEAVAYAQRLADENADEELDEAA